MRKLSEFLSLLRFNANIGFEFSQRELSANASADNHLRIAYLRESLAPLNKPNYYDFLVAKKPSLSSLSRDVVLVPISVRQERNKKRMFVQKSFFTLVKRRAHKLDTLEGLCSFVGGKRTNSDKNDVTTALREAHDQLGIDPKRLTILCQMSPVLAFGDHSPISLVSPVIAFYDQDDRADKINTQKVEFAFEVETDRFLRVDEYRRKSSVHNNREHYFHYFNFALDAPQQKRVNIWGMSSYLSIQIASILHSRVPSFEFDPERKLTGLNCNEFNEWYMLEKCGQIVDESIERAAQNRASQTKE